jgi:hypothetical protein
VGFVLRDVQVFEAASSPLKADAKAEALAEVL